MAGWGHALAAGVEGWFRGENMVKQNERYEKEEAWKDSQRARTLKKQQEEDQLDADLRRAAKPIAMEEGAGGMVKPPTMDNRDVGLAENEALPNNGLHMGGFQINGKAYTDRAVAEKALADQNTPDAVNSRAIEAYRSNGQFDKAMAMESNARGSEVQKMQLADMRWKRDLGTAMAKGHLGIAEFASNAEVGPMKGMKVQPIVSEDGKSVTYGAIDPADGQVKPIPGLPVFANDKTGITQAAFMLDRTIDPAARMAHADMMEQREQAQKNSDRSFNQSEEHLKLAKRGADRSDEQADVQLKTARLALNEAMQSAKIPQAVKMGLDGLRKEQDTISKAITEAQAKDQWNAESPNARALLKRQAVINAQIQKTLTPFMTRTPEANADLYKIRGQDETGARGDPAGAGGGRGPTLPPGPVEPPKSYKDPVWDKLEAEVGPQIGVPPEYLRIIRTVGEKSNDDQVSPKGAKTVYQFTEKSRELFKKKYDVDAYSPDARERVKAAAYHLKESYDRAVKAGNDDAKAWEIAMSGYNGGTSAEKGTNKTAENKAYTERTTAASRAIASEQGSKQVSVPSSAVKPTRYASGAVDAPPTPAPAPAPAAKRSSGSPALVSQAEAAQAMDTVGEAVGQRLASVSQRAAPAIDYSGMRNPNGGKPGGFVPEADPMQAVYAKEVGEIQRGIRRELSPDVSAWKQRMDSSHDKAREMGFSAAQAAAMQREKLQAERDAKKADKKS